MKAIFVLAFILFTTQAFSQKTPIKQCDSTTVAKKKTCFNDSTKNQNQGSFKMVNPLLVKASGENTQVIKINLRKASQEKKQDSTAVQ
ncbi:MAG: hypothetical protein QM727_02005 [Niabella sp.]